jgi:hypothetical protein
MKRAAAWHVQSSLSLACAVAAAATSFGPGQEQSASSHFKLGLDSAKSIALVPQLRNREQPHELVH